MPSVPALSRTIYCSSTTAVKNVGWFWNPVLPLDSYEALDTWLYLVWGPVYKMGIIVMPISGSWQEIEAASLKLGSFKQVLVRKKKKKGSYKCMKVVKEATQGSEVTQVPSRAMATCKPVERGKSQGTGTQRGKRGLAKTSLRKAKNLVYQKWPHRERTWPSFPSFLPSPALLRLPVGPTQGEARGQESRCYKL